MEGFAGILVLLVMFALAYYSFHLCVRAVRALEKTAHNLDRVARRLTDIIEVMKMERDNR
jgi:hypothetical protein